MAHGETSGAQSVLVQADGKVVAAGGTQRSDLERFALVRYGAHGRLDATFGGDGKVTTRFRARRCVLASAVALQADGNVVAAGSAGCRGTFALARYEQNGRLDTTFGGDGRVTTRFRSGHHYSAAFGMAIQADGKIVAAGVCCNSRFFALARYKPNGSLDSTFGGDGKVTTDFTRATDMAFDVAVQPDGRIVVAGVAARGSDAARFALARYKPNGRLDGSFGGDGKVTSRPSDCISEAHSVTVQPDGRIVAAGSAGCIDQLTVARYKVNGRPDGSFGGDGSIITSFGCPQSEANAVAVQPDGEIVASGYVACAGTSDVEFGFASARYDTDGSLDGSFGSGGVVTTKVWDPGCYQASEGVAIQVDGNILAAGGYNCGTARHTRFTLIRYLGG